MRWVDIIDIWGGEGDLPATIHREVGGYPLEALRHKLGVDTFGFRSLQKCGRVGAGYLAHRAAIDNWVQVWVHEVEDETAGTGVPVPLGIWNSLQGSHGRKQFLSQVGWDERVCFPDALSRANLRSDARQSLCRISTGAGHTSNPVFGSRRDAYPWSSSST